jgi:hypothetical protein
MYSVRYIQYVNFPQIPNELLNSIVPQTLLSAFNQSENKKSPSSYETYAWTDEANEQLNAWCQENICPDMYYAFQLITGKLPIHKDKTTKTKLNYLISTGGDDVLTTFYKDDQTTKLASYNISAHKWHIFKADTYHSVSELLSNQIRFAVTARIFE